VILMLAGPLNALAELFCAFSMSFYAKAAIVPYVQLLLFFLVFFNSLLINCPNICCCVCWVTDSIIK
jgi:hypothetical protein